MTHSCFNMDSIYVVNMNNVNDTTKSKHVNPY